MRVVRIMRVGTRAGLVLALAALGGCCGHRHASDKLEPDLPLVARNLPDFDVLNVPTLNDLPADYPSSSFTGFYRALSEQEAQCLAVEASQGAALLRQEGQLGSKGNKSKAELQEALNTYSGLEAMNRDAGNALELYFRLAKNEVRRDILDVSLAVVSTAVEQGEVMKQKGLKLPPELEEFTKKKNLLQADRVLVEQGLDKLNRMLARMIDLHTVPDPERILPTAELTVSPEPVDLTAAIAVGLANRPQLKLLRYARDEASRGNLSVIRDLLKTSSSLLGKAPSGPLAKLKSCLLAREISTRREQLDEAIAQAEKDVTGEVREAVEEIQAHAYLSAIVRQRVEDARKKVLDLQSKLAKGTASSAEVTSARLEELKARADLIHEAAAWNIGRTKLKKAQGLLVLECGHDYQPRYRRHLCEELRRWMFPNHHSSCPLRGRPPDDQADTVERIEPGDMLGSATSLQGLYPGLYPGQAVELPPGGEYVPSGTTPRLFMSPLPHAP